MALSLEEYGLKGAPAMNTLANQNGEPPSDDDDASPTRPKAFAIRLNGELDKRGWPPKGQGRQSKLGTFVGVSAKGARRWLEGEGLPSPDKMDLLVEKLGCSYEYLARGGGSSPEPQASHGTFLADGVDVMWLDLLHFIAEVKGGKIIFPKARVSLRLVK